MENFTDIRELMQNNVVQSRVWYVISMDTNTGEIKHELITSEKHFNIRTLWDRLYMEDDVALYEFALDAPCREAIMN